MSNNDSLPIHESPSVENIPQNQLQKSADMKQQDVQKNTVDVEKWAIELFNDIDAENPEEELSRVKKWVKTRRFYRGQQRGFWSPLTKDYVTVNPDDYHPTEASLLLINNQIRPQVKTLAKEWARSQTRLHANPVTDLYSTKGAARYAEGVLELYQRKLIQEDFKQREGKLAFLCGNYFRYTFYNLDAEGGTTVIPNFEEVEVVIGKDNWYCPTCDQDGYTSDYVDKNIPNGLCPNCFQNGITSQAQISQAPRKKVRRVAGWSNSPYGDIGCELVDPMQIKVMVGALNVNQSPYLRRKRLILDKILRYKYKHARIEATKISPVSHYTAELATSTGNTNAGRGTADGHGSITTRTEKIGRMVEFDQLWLDPPMYFDLVAEKDVTLGDGTMIHKGDNLIDLCPSGMYLARCGDELLDAKPEEKRRFWTHGNYDILVDSFWGDGVEDLVQNQQLVNEIQSLLVENLIHNASPKLIFNPHLIEHELLNGRPKEMIPMSISSRRDDQPGKAVYELTGMSLTPEAINAMDKAKNDMQYQSGAFPVMAGLSAPNVSTATGMAILRDSAIALLTPALALKAQVEVEWGYQVLEHLKEHWVEDRYAGLIGKYSRYEADNFRNLNIRQDIEIVAEPGSWMPRTDLEVRQDFLTYLTAGGIPLGFANPQVPEEIRNRAAALFRLPLDLDKIQPDVRNAYMRIEQLQQIVTELQQHGIVATGENSVQLVEMVASEIPVDMWIDDHDVFINTYTQWLKTDDGLFADPLTREALKYIILQHQDAIEQVQEEGMKRDAQLGMAQAALQGAANSVMGQDQQQQQGQPQPSGQQQPPPPPPPPDEQSGGGSIQPPSVGSVTPSGQPGQEISNATGREQDFKRPGDNLRRASTPRPETVNA
jgi:hypothetical protein